MNEPLHFQHIFSTHANKNGESPFARRGFHHENRRAIPISRVLFPDLHQGPYHLSMRPTLRGRTGHPPMGRKKKTSPHSRFTWSYSPQGLSELCKLPHILVSSYLTFAPSPDETSMKLQLGCLNFCNTVYHLSVTQKTPPLFTGCGAHCSPDFPLLFAKQR